MNAGRLIIGGTLAAIAAVAASPFDARGLVDARGRAAGSLTGQLLVATEDLHDPRFVRTVIYMLQHDAGGAMGLVVNRPVGAAPLARLLEQFGLEGHAASGSIRVHYGGPVEPGHAFVLHTTDYTGDGTRVIKDGIALTMHPEILDALAQGRGPRHVLLMLGYAGWAPGQLEAEIQRGSWITVPSDETLLFDDEAGKKWERATARRKIEI